MREAVDTKNVATKGSGGVLTWFSRDITYLLTYLLTPWCRVLLDKLTGLQLVKEFPAFHGIRRFITALTSVRHLSLSWASPIQSRYTHPTSWRSFLILFIIIGQISKSGTRTPLREYNAWWLQETLSSYRLDGKKNVCG